MRSRDWQRICHSYITGLKVMAPAFPFPPPSPPQRGLSWSSWLVIAVIVMLIVIAAILMYSSAR
jgi:hypothetical protein